MIYFSLTISHAEITQLIGQVDRNSFCLWQDEKTSQLFGVVKDSAYEYFVVACSIHVLRHMRYFTLDEIIRILSREEPLTIYGNRQLMVRKVLR